MKGFLLDTNIFNHLVEGRIKLNDLPLEYPIFVTYLQRDEIMQCSNLDKRGQLLSWLKVLPDHEVILETFLAGIARAGKVRVGNGKLYRQLLQCLGRQKHKKRSNVFDALIGEAAIVSDLILVTNDKNLAKAVKSLGGYVRGISNHPSQSRST